MEPPRPPSTALSSAARGLTPTLLPPAPAVGTAQPPSSPLPPGPPALAWGCRWLLTPSPPPCPRPPHVQSTSKPPGEGGSTALSPPAEPLHAACPSPSATARTPHALPGARLGAARPPLTAPGPPGRGTRTLCNATHSNKTLPVPKTPWGGPKLCLLFGSPGREGGGARLRVPPGSGDRAGDKPRVGASSPGRANSCRRGSAGRPRG